MFSSDKWFGAEAGFYPETIDQSVRFNDDNSPQLSKTFGTPTSNTKMIYATWFKTTENSSHQTFFSGGSNSFNYMVFALSTASFYTNSDSLFFHINTSNTARLALRTDTTYGQFFADTTNWQHILLAIDTTQATNTNRILIFHNGKRLAHSDMSFTTYPSQDYSVPLLNTAVAHNFGFNKQDSVASYGSFDGYFAETYFLDGQSIFSDTSGTINSTFLADATTLAMFCEQKNGIAVPKTYSGTFGNNGVKLTYADSSSFGDDTSGNGNDFTSSGLTASDSVSDTPTNNFATLNVLQTASNASTFYFTQGNLALNVTNNSGYRNCSATFSPMGMKGYFEFTVVTGTPNFYIGVIEDTTHPTNMDYADTSHNYVAFVSNGGVYQNEVISSQGNKIVRSVSDFNVGTIAAGKVMGMAFDFTGTNRRLWFHNENTYGTSSTGVGNPSTGANPVITESYLDSNQDYRFHFGINTGSGLQTVVFNFGQDGTFANNETAQGNTDSNGNGNFYYAPPTDFLALCSQNLTTGAISPDADSQVDDFFRTVIYTGNGYPTSNGQTITGVGFQPDWTWIKVNRNGYNHYLLDSVRGATKVLRTTSTNAQNTESTALTSWNSDGFVLGSNNEVNYQNDTIASWNWKAGGAPSADNSAGAGNVPTSNSVIIDGVSKTDALAGTIPATRISANTTSGFSIITYTGTGTAGTVAHGLGKTPALLLTKNISWSHEYSAWLQWHHKRDNAFNASTNYGYMNLTSTGGSSTTSFYNGSQIDADVFGIGTNDAINDASYSYVTYAFTEIAGYSKFGLYEGSGSSTNNAYVYCGFTPKYLLIKNIDASSDWVIRDDFNSGYYTRAGNPKSIGFEANTTKGHQGAISWRVDFLSNGFKIISSQTDLGASNTYYYWAFGNDFKFSNGI